MNLVELLSGIVEETAIPGSDFQIKGIALDSREVKKDYVFFALAGAMEHGLLYAKQAVENGAFSVIYDSQGSDEFQLGQFEVELLRVKNLRVKLGYIADRFYQSPSKELAVIGVTGTNGKTTCSQFLLQLISACGVIGTLGWGTTKTIKKTANTTPDALAVQQILANFVVRKKQAVVMEVSSHGLEQGRVNGVQFKGAVFTNLSRDHLDYHGSMAAYLEAKLLLFKQPGLQFAVVNIDDPYGEKFLAVVDKKTTCWAYSATGKTSSAIENVTADEVRYSVHGIAFMLCWRLQKMQVKTRIVGDFNLENILAVITVLLAQGQGLTEVLEKVSGLSAVAGRMEGFGGNNKPFVLVDYAHSPDALDKVLKGVKRDCQGKLWLVFGCGGNRDKGKRSAMGAIACKLADAVTITNDNPRFEDPAIIIKEILAGCHGDVCEVIQNRQQAIQSVIKRAQIKDCIVIAGKGHEDYQEVNGIKQPFSDQSFVRQGLRDWS